MSPIVWLAITFGLSAGGTWAIRAFAVRRGLYDHPIDRSSHHVPTPRLGGIAIAVAGIAGWAGTVSSGGLSIPAILPAAVGGGLVALVGLIDDLKCVSPLVKLAGQIVAVGVSLVVGAAVGVPANVGVLVMAGLWLLTYMNFFNFMDGSDGMAGGVALLAMLGLALLAREVNAIAVLRMDLILSAAAAGFLVFNFPPGSIFMGDTGSLFLGYGIGLVAFDLLLAGLSPVAGGLVLSPFLFDAGFTLLSRAANGRALWRAHRSHLYQRLLAAGASHRRVAFIYYAWTVIAFGLAWAWVRSPPAWHPPIGLLAFLPAAVLVWYVSRCERTGARIHESSGE